MWLKLNFLLQRTFCAFKRNEFRYNFIEICEFPSVLFNMFCCCVKIHFKISFGFPLNWFVWSNVWVFQLKRVHQQYQMECIKNRISLSFRTFFIFELNTNVVRLQLKRIVLWIKHVFHISCSIFRIQHVLILILSLFISFVSIFSKS